MGSVRRYSAGLLLLTLVVFLMAGCSKNPQKHIANGKEYFAQGKYNEAMIEFRNAVKADPKLSEAHYNLALVQLTVNQTADAETTLFKTVQLNSGNNEAQLYLGNIRLMDGKFEDARGKADLVLKRNPKDIRAHILRGNTYAQMIQLDSSIGDIKKGMQYDPRIMPPYRNLAERRDSRREVESAEASYKDAAATDPGSVLPKVALANFYMLIERPPAESEKLLKEALAADPKSADANYALGFFYLKNNRLAEAEAAYARVRDAYPNEALPKIIFADFLMNTGQTDRAMEAYRKLSGESATNILGRRRLASIYLSRKEPGKAAPLVDEILKIDPKNADGQTLRGQLLLMQKKVPEAMQALKAALKAKPSSAQAHYLLGLAHVNSGDTEQGEKELVNALYLDRMLTSPLLALAQVKLSSGDSQTAATLAEQALQMNPNLDEARLILANALTIMKDFTKAKTYLEEFISKNPSNDVGHYQLGYVYKEQGNPQQAENEFELSLKANPQNFFALASLAELYISQKNPQKALTRINQAIAQNPQQADLYEVLSRTYLEMKDPAKAEEAMLKAASIDPKKRRELSSFYANAGEAGKSVQTLETLVRENPDNAEYKAQLANAHLSQKAYSKANAIADEILKADAKSPDGLMIKGRILLAQNKTAEALDQFKAAVAADPKSARARYLLGLVNLQSGNRAEAEKQWAEAAKNPGGFAAPALAVAKLKLESRDADEALRYSGQALTIDRNNRQAQLIQGSANLLKKNYREAAAILEPYVQANPADAVGQQRLGSAYLGAKDFPRAEQHFETALGINPASTEALQGIAGVYVGQRKPEKAEQRLNQQLGRLSGPAQAPAFRLLAELYMSLKNSARAEEMFKKAIQADPKNSAHRTALAAFYEWNGESGKSADVLGNLSKEQPGSAANRKQMAALYLEQKSWDKGIQAIDEVLKANAKDAEAHVLKSRLLLGQGKADAAIASAQAAANADPKSVAARYALGQAYYAKDPKDPKVESAWNEAINNNRNNVTGYLALSQLKLELNDPASAIRYAQQALRVDQKNADARLLMGRAYERQRDTENARAQYQEYLKIKPDSPEVRAMVANTPAEALQEINQQLARSPNQPRLYEMQGQIYASQKEYAKAEQAYRKALSFDGNNYNSCFLLGMLYREQKLFDKAIREFENAAKINPKSPQSWFMMGMSYEQQKNVPKAMQYYRKALEVDPQYAQAANNLAWLIGESKGDLREALDLARTAKKNMPDDPSVSDTLGWLYYRSGAYRSAVDALKECVEKNPKNPVYHYHLGMSYFKMGDKANAKASLSKALNLSQGFSGAEEARETLAKL